jgi:hypothetical protein
VLANDPWTGKVVRYYWSEFNRSWGYFGNMALAIEPCPLAAPVDPSTLAVRSLSSAQMVWSWSAAAHAAQYRVTVSRIRSKAVKVVYQGVQAATRLAFAAPAGGGRYEIDVQSVSACGDATAPARLQVLLPAILPTPTPSETPVPERTVVTTPTPTPAVTASAISTPTVTPTPTATSSGAH